METATVDISKSKPFTQAFTSKGIRVAGSPHKPLFVAIDVAKHIGDQNLRKKLNKFSSKYLVKAPYIDSLNRMTEMNFLTEKGLYKYLLKSDKPEAEPFQEWVFDRLCEMRLQIIDNKDLELKIANDNVQLVTENISMMTESVYEDTRLDSCPVGLAEFYIARYIANYNYQNKSSYVTFNREMISQTTIDLIYGFARLHFRKDQHKFKQIVEESLQIFQENQNKK